MTKLTNRETAYQLFLKHRELTAKQIIQLTQIPQSSIHRALKDLNTLNLIQPYTQTRSPGQQGPPETTYRITPIYTPTTQQA